MNTASGNIQTILLALAGGVAFASGCAGSETTTGTSSSDSVAAGGDASASGPVLGGSNLFPLDAGAPNPGTEFEGGGPIGFCGGTSPPTFGTPVTCTVPPPPISGGTLLITADGKSAIAADSDRDAIYVVDLGSKTVKFTIVLQPGDEPGRLAEDGAGRVHVALRGSGMLATIDPTGGTVTARRPACPAPRGVAWQSSSDVVWVACATGELVSLPAAGGNGTVQHVQRDLRDVIVSGGSLAVTEFRSSQVLRLASDNVTVARTDSMPPTFLGTTFSSQVLWRAVPGPSGSIVTVHQAESTQSVSTKATGGYGCGAGGGGGPPVPVPAPIASGGDEGGPGVTVPVGVSFASGGPMASVITVVASDGTISSNETFQGVLPVDVASAADGSLIAAVAAGSGSGMAGDSAATDNLFLFGKDLTSVSMIPGQPIAVAIEADDTVLVQTREPAALWMTTTGSATGTGEAGPTSIPLSTVSRKDTGHDIFHTHAGAMIACASCHPEGGDDGHTWILDGNERRTPSMRGTIAGTAPYHWPGDEANFTSIVNDVYEIRMGGGKLTTPQITALNSWVEGIPAPKAPTWVDASAAQAGRTIFARSDVGCATCHSGSKFTNNATMDVGTGGSFQVPPLVGVGWRTPLMHDGCAATIADRFGSCSTKGHGNIASLSTQDVANLTAYLETL